MSGLVISRRLSRRPATVCASSAPHGLRGARAVEHWGVVHHRRASSLIRVGSPRYSPAAADTRGLTNSVRPPTIVAATPPRSFQPSNGVFRDLDRIALASTVTGTSGARIVMSAGAPGVSEPPGTRRMRAGFTDKSSTSRGRPDESRVHETIERQRHSRLEAHDPERRTIELDVLLVVMVWRVVGRNRRRRCHRRCRRASHPDRRLHEAEDSS